MIKIMAVYDEDPLYARRLADYVNHREKLPFTAMAFSGLEELEAYGKEHEIEILLAGERAMAQIREHQGTIGAKQAMILCEGELAQKKRKRPPSTNISQGTALCGRLWPATAAIRWSRDWRFCPPGQRCWGYILR